MPHLLASHAGANTALTAMTTTCCLQKAQSAQMSCQAATLQSNSLFAMGRNSSQPVAAAEAYQLLQVGCICHCLTNMPCTWRHEQNSNTYLIQFSVEGQFAAKTYSPNSTVSSGHAVFSSQSSPSNFSPFIWRPDSINAAAPDFSFASSKPTRLRWPISLHVTTDMSSMPVKVTANRFHLELLSIWQLSDTPAAAGK